MRKNLILLSLIFLLFTSCANKKSLTQKNLREEVSFLEIDGFFEDDLNYALEVFKKDCQKSKRFEQLKNVCQKAKYANSGVIFFVSNFTPYKLYDSNFKDEGLITGYHEPLLYGSLKKTSRYKYPVYKIPKNLITYNSNKIKGKQSIGKIVGRKIVPYDTREEIQTNSKNKNLKAIAYVDDKVDLFFLQIQGSGKIKLDTNEIINVGYAGQNGHPYFSIGKYLIEEGYILKEDISVQEIKKFFANNPLKVDEILNLNESYVFFKVSNQGATGALGTLLTAKRNIAVDRSYIELGMPVFVNTQNPVTKEPIKQLMIAADVGGAIKGEIRADFFWGFTEEAFEYAGRMKENGKMYILVPKD